MTATEKKPADAAIGDTLVSPNGTRWPVVGATDAKIQVRDDSVDRTAAWSRYVAATKWYTRRSKIIATWTVEEGSA
jgi:hypothetical protein